MAKNTLAQQVFCLLVQEERSKKFWRPEIAIWRLNILVQSPVGANIKKLISDPGVVLNQAKIITTFKTYNICISNADTISRSLDLTINPQTNERKPRQAIRDQLDMTACLKTVDSCIQAGRIRDALSDKLWGERNLQGSYWMNG